MLTCELDGRDDVACRGRLNDERGNGRHHPVPHQHRLVPALVAGLENRAFDPRFQLLELLRGQVDVVRPRVPPCRSCSCSCCSLRSRSSADTEDNLHGARKHRIGATTQLARDARCGWNPPRRADARTRRRSPQHAIATPSFMKMLLTCRSDRPLAEDEVGGDRFVGRARGDQAQDLQFPRRQPVRVESGQPECLARARSGAAPSSAKTLRAASSSIAAVSSSPRARHAYPTRTRTRAAS